MNRFTPTVLDAPSSIRRLQDGESELRAFTGCELGFDVEVWAQT